MTQRRAEWLNVLYLTAVSLDNWTRKIRFGE